MKVAFVQPLLAKYTIDFFNKLSEIDGVEVVVLADLTCDNSLNQYDSKLCQFTVIHLRDVKLFGFRYRPKLNSILKKINYDRLVLNATPRDLSQIYQLLKHRTFGKKIYSWGMFHRIGPKRFVSELYFILAGLLSTKCLTYTKRGFYSQLSRGIKSDKLAEIGTAINEQLVFCEINSRSSQDIFDFKSKNGLLDKKVILQVVRLSEIKKPRLLVDAAIELCKKNEDYIFILIGGGELESELKETVLNKNLSERIRFLGPIYDEKILSHWFLSSDIFVIPSCIGLSAHHAMCYSLPIVTDDDYERQASEFEILANGLNCVLYKKNDSSSLTSVISELLGDDDKRKLLAKNARVTVENVHNLKSKVASMLTAISD